MTHFTFRCAGVLDVSIAVFVIMQLLFDGPTVSTAEQGMAPHSRTCKMDATTGHFLGIGLLGDFALAVTVSLFTIWVWA